LGFPHEALLFFFFFPLPPWKCLLFFIPNRAFDSIPTVSVVPLRCTPRGTFSKRLLFFFPNVPPPLRLDLDNPQWLYPLPLFSPTHRHSLVFSPAPLATRSDYFPNFLFGSAFFSLKTPCGNCLKSPKFAVYFSPPIPPTSWYMYDSCLLPFFYLRTPLPPFQCWNCLFPDMALSLETKTDWEHPFPE